MSRAPASSPVQATTQGTRDAPAPLSQPNLPGTSFPCSCEGQGVARRDAPSRGSRGYSITSLLSVFRLPSLLLPVTTPSPPLPGLCPDPRTRVCRRHGVCKARVRPHSQPERVPPLSDDPGEPGQPPGVHFDPLVQVVPSRAPRPVVEVIFINARLERNRGVLQKDPESTRIEVHLFKGGRGRE